MGLSLDAFTAESKPRKGPRCTVGKLIEAMSPADAKVLTDALAASVDDITHAAITRVLRAEGHSFDASTIGRHRKGECACAT